VAVVWKICNVEIKNQVVLAPMAGVGNSAFRRIIKEMGCGLICCEMVSDKALTYGSEKTMRMLKMEESERPISQQIFGSDKDSFITAAKIVYENMHPDIIDINMGCPVPKVALHSQAGSALLKDPQKVKEIVSAVVNAVPIPVTVKIRSGWDHNSINAIEIAKVCEEAGASAITIHGRTRSDMYDGNVDLDIIKKVKESVSIPVIGNGDIKTCYDAKHMLDYTGCDAIMIGRGVLGNPWLIRDCVNYLNNGEEPIKVSYEDKFNMIKKHLDYLMEIKPEHVAVSELRAHAAWYLKGIPGSNKYKDKFFKATSREEILKILEEMNAEYHI
jgi:tRNA-dihydrouridine synthase B